MTVAAFWAAPRATHIYSYHKKGRALFPGKDSAMLLRTLALAGYFRQRLSNVWEDQTHSVSLESRKASSTALTRHSLQSRGALGTGVSGGTGVSLRESRI